MVLINLTNSGPYLDNSNRLQDVLAAIQVLGTYEFAVRELDKWANLLGRKPKSEISKLRMRCTSSDLI